jgi:hypothetical protein
MKLLRRLLFVGVFVTAGHVGQQISWGNLTFARLIDVDYAFVVFSILYLAILFLKPKLHGQNLLKFRASGGDAYILHHATGTVYGVSKGHSATAHMSGGQVTGASVIGNQINVHQTPVTVTTTSHVHDQFYLSVPGRTDISMQLTDVNVAVADGQLVTVVWAVPKRKDRGPYILIRNHTTGNVWPVKGALRDLIVPKLPGVVPLMVAACLFATLVYPGLPSGTNFLIVALVFIVYMIIRSMVATYRSWRFRANWIPRLVAELDNLAGNRKFAEKLTPA